MIVNFSVENFGPIKDKQTLSFEATKSKDLEEHYVIEPIEGIRLLKLALIYGPNGSGKSTILQAIDFLRSLVIDPLEKRDLMFEYNPFLFDVESPSKTTHFEMEFIQDSTRYLYLLELNRKTVVAESLYVYNPNKSLVYERSTDLTKQLSSIKFGSKIKLQRKIVAVLEANTLWNNTVLGGYLKTNLESNDLKNVVEWFGGTLKTVVNPKTNLLDHMVDQLERQEISKRNIIKVLQKADFPIADIVIENKIQVVNEPLVDFLRSKMNISGQHIAKIKEQSRIEISEVAFMHELNGQFYELSYQNQSEGTQRYFQLSGLLETMIRHRNILPIDEIESSLHPDLLKHFLLTFLVNAKSSQLIATTHYRELLQDRDIFRNDAIWFTEKQKDGSTSLFSLDDFDSSVVRDTSSVYNAYKIGKLGAVPNLGDYYIDLGYGEA